MKYTGFVTKQMGYVKPIFMTLYLPIAGALNVLAAMLYLHLKPDPILLVICIGLIFSIYMFNCFTDYKEDYVNDIAKLNYFLKRKLLFRIGAMAMVLSVLLLIATQKLNQYHIVLISAGLCYSYRLLPWYNNKRGFYFIRLKEIPCVKSILVSFLWSISIFAMPLLFLNQPLHFTIPLCLLIISITLSTFNNTVFNDIRDCLGDSFSNTKTLPTILGSKNTLRLLGIIDVIWILTLLISFLTHSIDKKHLAFLMIVALYPIVYISMYYRGKFSRELVNLISEFDLMIFASGLALLCIE